MSRREKNTSVGLVTWYKGPNYGTVLQAFALVRVLEIMGCDVRVIKYFRDSARFSDTVKNLLSAAGLIALFKGPRHPWKAKMKRMDEFVRANIPQRSVPSPSSRAAMLRDTDVFVAGSDQLWNCNHHFRSFELLGFAGDSKRISYATSMGGGHVPEAFRAPMAAALSKFSAISLRERSGAEAVAALTGRNDIRTVLDPTLLLRAQDWELVAAQADLVHAAPDGGVFEPGGGPYIFCYLLGEADHAAAVDKIKAATGVSRVVILPSNENPLLSLPGAAIAADAGPREFISLLSGAAYVCTDSFHGCALSLALGRQFVAFKRFADGPGSQNDRLSDLFSLTLCGDRFFDGEMPSPIDYGIVGERISDLRFESLDFLEKAI